MTPPAGMGGHFKGAIKKFISFISWFCDQLLIDGYFINLGSELEFSSHGQVMNVFIIWFCIAIEDQVKIKKRHPKKRFFLLPYMSCSLNDLVIKHSVYGERF